MNTVQLRSQRGIVLAEKAKKQHLDKWTPNGRLQQPAPENRYTVPSHGRGLSHGTVCVELSFTQYPSSSLVALNIFVLRLWSSSLRMPSLQVIQEPKFLGFTKAKAMENFLWRESKKPRPKKRVKRGDEMRFY